MWGTLSLEQITATFQLTNFGNPADGDVTLFHTLTEGNNV